MTRDLIGDIMARIKDRKNLARRHEGRYEQGRIVENGSTIGQCLYVRRPTPTLISDHQFGANHIACVVKPLRPNVML